MRKRVIMYTPAMLFSGKVTGGSKRFLELYIGLTEKDVDVILFSSDNQEELSQLGTGNKSIRYVNPDNKVWVPAMIKSFIANYKLINNIKRMEYDSLIVFDVPTALNFCILGLSNIDLFIRQDLISYKTISINERTRNTFIKKIYLLLMRLSEYICIHKAKRIIVQCEYDKKELYKRHIKLKESLDKKVIVQINNVNPSWIVEKSRTNKKKDRNVFFTICFVGDFDNERKGHGIFIESVIKLIKQRIKIEAILIGGGKKLDSVKEQYKNCSEIKFMGRVDNPIEIMNKCDLMVVPSLADSCPNTVMEALYNEIPVIGANSGGIPEILNNPNALFDTNSLSLEDKIKYYLEEDNLVKLKEQQKNRKYELTFDWSYVILQHLELNQ